MKLWIILTALSAGILVFSADGTVPAGPGSAPSGAAPRISVTENIQKSEDARRRMAEGRSGGGNDSDSMGRDLLRNEIRALRETLRVQADKYEKRLSDLETARRAELTELEEENARLKADLAEARRILKASRRKLLPEEKAGVSAGNGEDLRGKLLETLEKSSVNLEKLQTLELSAASVIDTLEPVNMTTRERELSWTLELVLRTGMKLAGRSAVTAETLLKHLPEMKLDEVERAKIRIGLEELRKEAGLFAQLNITPGEAGGFESCRILEVSEKLGVAILSAGYRNGVRVNLRLTAENGRETPLRVIAVRPYVSAAVPEKGGIGDLLPGMVLKAVRQLKE